MCSLFFLFVDVRLSCHNLFLSSCLYLILLLQGGNDCVSADGPTLQSSPLRRKRATDSGLYKVLLQRLQHDLHASLTQPSDYDYVGQQQQPYERKRNAGSCYFHAINCWWSLLTFELWPLTCIRDLFSHLAMSDQRLYKGYEKPQTR